MKSIESLRQIQKKHQETIKEIEKRFNNKNQKEYNFQDYSFIPDRSAKDLVKGLKKKNKKIKIVVHYDGKDDLYNLIDDCFTTHDMLHILRIMENISYEEKRSKKKLA